MNVKTAWEQVAEAKRLLEQARDLLTKDVVSDTDRSDAAVLREQATKLRSDAEALALIEREAKAMPKPIEGKMARADVADDFETFGEFIVAAREAKATGRSDPRLKYMARDADEVGASQRKALSGTAGASGGFLMPERWIAELNSVMLETSTVLPRVTTIPMSTRTVSLPVVDYARALPEGEPRQFGGVQAYYQDEGVESVESEPRFREHTLTAHELAVYTEANNSLLADSAVSLEAFLASGMGMQGALMWKIEHKIFNGNGVGQPLGILNAPATIAVPRELTGEVDYLDLARMDEKTLPSGKLAWFASISMKTRLRTLKDDANQLIWASAGSGLPATLLGYPIYFTEHLPRIGGRGDIVLADMSYYLFGDRQAATLDVSTEANFRRNRTGYRMIHRHDGSSWMNAPITLSDTVTQVSPFVVLDSAQS
ncbi:MAG: phage major capsid protein [Chloroflexota bacterium]|nr:phage major capsid protein [Chloroflexota bacterium]